MKAPIVLSAIAMLQILAAGVAVAQTHEHGHTGQPGAMSGSGQMDMKGHGGMNMGAMPANLDTARTRLSEKKRYKVTLTPQTPKLAINVMHRWRLHVVTPDGHPVRGATVSVDGGMPQHGHGLPTAPRVTRDLGDGNYDVEGVKFNMTGWWQLTFGIESGGQKDSVTFNVVLK